MGELASVKREEVEILFFFNSEVLFKNVSNNLLNVCKILCGSNR